MSVVILGIESSCDDTSAAIIRDQVLLSNFIANQDVHRSFGGVVPELASRAHQQNIIPVVDMAIRNAGISPSDITAIAFTRGPGLLGSLIVGTSFAKGLSISLGVPLIEVNHLMGHILVHFIRTATNDLVEPPFPFLCLLVSGGHTQIVVVRDYFDMEIIGQTIDDAAGEAFDKCAKVMGLPYPGGPHVDRLAKIGNAQAFNFAKPRIDGLNYSFSGLKTSFLYTLRDESRNEPDFVANHQADLCASLQRTIIEILMEKLVIASDQTGIRNIVLAGGVAANSGLRDAVTTLGQQKKWKTFIPPLKYTTDNAAMIAITGYFKYFRNEFAPLDIAPLARTPFGQRG